MKKIWLFIIWLCAIFSAWNFSQASENFINNSFTKPNGLYNDITKWNKESNNPSSGYHIENTKNRLNDLQGERLGKEDNSIASLFFNISKFCILFWIFWIIFMGIICNKKSWIGRYISNKIQVVSMHIKIFILWIFKFSWIDEKIDLHSWKLNSMNLLNDLIVLKSDFYFIVKSEQKIYSLWFMNGKLMVL